MRRIACAGATRFGRLVLIVTIASLAACGKGGSSSSPAPTPPSKLFVADSGNHAIASFVNSNPAPGSGTTPVPVDRIITGSNANLPGNIPALALDATNDRMYVSNEGAIIVFNNASTANGNVGPARTVATAIAGNFTSLYLDAVNDRLYVGDLLAGVKIFDSAGTVTSAAPNRTLTGNFVTGFNIRGVAVDVTRDILYVAVTASNPTPLTAIHVFDSAHDRDGSQTPDRTITFAPASDFRIFLDAANDRLYVSDLGGVISVFDGVHTLTGPAPAADRTISLGGGAGLTTLALDPGNDRLFAAAHSSLIVIPGASTANGIPMNATALIAPPGGDVTAAAVKP